jgi:hypothetical protein
MTGFQRYLDIGLRVPFCCRLIGMTSARDGFSSVHRVEISSAKRLEPMIMITRLVAMRGGSSLTTRSRGLFCMSHIYLKVPGLVSVFELPSIKLSIPPFELPSFRADYPRNGRTVRGYRQGLSFGGSLELPSCFDHAPQNHQILA